MFHRESYILDFMNLTHEKSEGAFPIGLSMQSSVCSVEDVLGDDCSDLEL